jgi:serine O-acetyltransferase
MGPIRLWKISSALRRRGHRRLALLVKKVNSAIYHNSLAPGARYESDIEFGHHGFGTVIHANVTIGRRVKIWQGVTLAVRGSTGSPHRIIIEDDVRIGSHAVIITPHEQSLRIGRGARIGAGVVVTSDVPEGATVVSVPARVIERGNAGAQAEAAGEGASAGDAGAPIAGEPDGQP